ncbi:MAG: hypothetical protein ACRD4S_16895 [Candidatus Acidiferrales bacterium]
MRIKTEINIDLALKVAATLLRQLPYATNNAITRTAKEAVDAGKQELAKDFTIRKTFILSRVRILQYSRVGNLTCVLGIDKRVQGSPLLLGFFEEGGTKEPTRGSGIAIPITGGPARPEFSDKLKASLSYPNLKLTGGKGKKKTFVIPNVGVFERIAPGGRVWDSALHKSVTTDRSATAMVYAFKPNAPLKSRMNLLGVMRAVIASRFNAIFAEEFTREILRRAGKR